MEIMARNRNFVKDLAVGLIPALSESRIVTDSWGCELKELCYAQYFIPTMLDGFLLCCFVVDNV